MTTKSDFQRHPLSAKFGDISGAYLDELADDIQKNGQHESGVTLDDKILDGWHRYIACIRVGVDFESKPFRGKDPAAFVLSKNLHRRHMVLNGSQRALLVVSVHEWRGSGFIGEKQDSHSKPAPGAGFGASEKQMAEEARVGERTIQQAKVVEANGSHELKEAVRDGDISLKDAEPIARKPQAEQPAALKKAVNGEKPAKPKPAKPMEHETSDKVKELSARIVELEAELAEMNERLPDLIHSAESALAFSTNADFIEMQILRGELRDAKRAEATAKRERNEMLKQLNYWKRRAEKCEGKK